MAVRELLAEFTTKFDSSNLDMANAKIDAFEGSLRSTFAFAEGGVQVPIALEVGNVQPKLDELSAQMADRQIQIMAGGDTSAAQEALAALEVEALQTQERLVHLGDELGLDASARLDALARQLQGLGDVRTADPKALREVRAEAILVERELTRIGQIDATNPSLPALQGQLKTLRGNLVPPVQQATAGIGGLTAAFRGMLPVIGAAAIANWGQSVVSAAGDVADLAVKINMTVEETQAWQMVLQGAGADLGALESGSRALGNAIADAGKAGSEQAKAFEALFGAGAALEVQARPLSEVMIDVGAALNEVENEAQRMDLANKLLGRGSQALLPVFKAGAAATREQLAAMKEHAAFSEAFAKESDELGDQMMVFKADLMGATAGVLKFFMPALKTTIDFFGKFLRAVTPARVALAGVTAGFAFWPTIAARVGTLVKGLGGMSGILSRLGGMLGRVAVFAARFVLPFLILDDIIVFLQGGDSLLGRWLEKLGGLGTSAQVLQDLSDLWNTLTGSIQIAWTTLTGGTDIMANLSADQIAALNRMAEMWDGFGSMMGDIWDGVKNDAAFALTWIGDQLADMLAKIPLIGEDMAAAIRPVRDAEGKLPGEGKGVFDQDGFTGGGQGLGRDKHFQMTDNVQVPPTVPGFQMFPEAAVMAPPPPPGPTNIENNPNITANFYNTGTPATADAAAGTVARGVTAKLKANNAAQARAAGVGK